MKKIYFIFFAFLACTSLHAEEVSQLNLAEVLKSAPFIYALLGGLSLFSFALWVYSLLTLRSQQFMPLSFVKQVKDQLLEKRYEAALVLCERSSYPIGRILAEGISMRQHGSQALREAIQAEGKRHGVLLWQRLALLQDIAAIAPMLGLLGTVLGLFYAFYDVNRSPETLTALFDGLGIAVGTTVAGLIVAIFSMLFYAMLKFRLVRLLNQMEHQAFTLGHLLEKP